MWFSIMIFIHVPPPCRVPVPLGRDDTWDQETRRVWPPVTRSTDLTTSTELTVAGSGSEGGERGLREGEGVKGRPHLLRCWKKST